MRCLSLTLEKNITIIAKQNARRSLLASSAFACLIL